MDIECPDVQPMNSLPDRIHPIRYLVTSLIFSFLVVREENALSDDLYWDADGELSASTGGTGTWTTPNTWRITDSLGTLQNWVDGNDAYFGGTAGVVTIGATAVDPITSYFTTTGYTLQTDPSTTTRSHLGNIVLSAAVELRLHNAATTAGRALNLGGSVTGGADSTIVIQGSQSDLNAARINLSVDGATLSVPTTIGSSGTGLAGYVATAINTSISGSIINNTTARTMLGAAGGNDLTFTSTADHSGTGSLQFSISSGTTGDGIVRIDGTFSHTGETIFSQATSGVIRMGGNNRLSNDSLLVFVQGTLDLNGTTQTVAGLSGGGGRGIVNTSVNEGVISIDVASGTQTYSGAIGTPGTLTNITGANDNIAIAKTGNGTQILTGANTYNGGTTVSGGTFLANNTSGSATGSGAVSVTNGATFGGTGSVSGNTTIGDGATITAGDVGNVAFDDLSFGGSLAVGQAGGASTTWLVDLVGGTGHDTIGVAGALSLSDVMLDIDFSNVGAGDSFIIASYGSLTGTFSNTESSGIYSIGGGSWTINYGSIGNNFITVTAVPEPGAFGLLGIALAWYGVRRFRRGTKSQEGG